MALTANQIWGAKQTAGEYIATGVFQMTHNLGHTDYNVFCQVNQSGIYTSVESKGSNSCIIYVRTFPGTLIDGLFSYQLVGDNW